MLNKKLINKRKQTMLKITKGGETINNNNEKVATITLEDCSVWNLTEYMYVDWDEFTETTHEELYECGWVQSYMLNDIVDYMNENEIEINETTYRLELLNFIAENYNNEVEYEKF
jgi:hypothetical protein